MGHHRITGISPVLGPIGFLQNSRFSFPVGRAVPRGEGCVTTGSDNRIENNSSIGASDQQLRVRPRSPQPEGGVDNKLNVNGVHVTIAVDIAVVTQLGAHGLNDHELDVHGIDGALARDVRGMG